ncbi:MULTISPECIES: hypothetical protein [Streptomyces]|uniref:Uncharacterized protein n=1 Tax=Streptomyces griseus subsp. griseus (strain JCM 4626 / CBS 651.72 / NBRC 13350 / KCC S-0626 / ISP 5235) TaxID=455632 RepID=B1VMR2_STRGG|nr:hypothetical protein [Streptomyces griseus]MYR16684.1 hypothetical protein [Streptomyces sp. SID724]MBW3709294.1 hypothetical protein [Streptomyces griseus]SEE32297.1 hypothetical protein SAMN04490359_2716 [Streptomyces griseus]SQA25177.1 Uncharacterised protein [Streptomyces griseus]BAG23537.1 hypothetical protein SGR_6708 [Streptomyces griseus subsp. griseus NBRC 13350]
MSDRPVGDMAGERPDGWAETVVAGLEAARAAERALGEALRPGMSLKEEKAQRRAEAVRAAAMGLGAEGCAAAAGISERLLASWRAEDPVFDAALSAARSLAHVHDVVPDVTANPAVLRMALDAILDGVPFVAVGALVGAKRDAFYRLRRGNPRLGALFGAAQNARRRTTSPGRKKKAELKGYRLVRLDSPAVRRSDPVR